MYPAVYIVIDLVLLAGLGLLAWHLAGLRRWRRGMQGPAGRRLWGLLPSVLVDVALPLAILLGLPLASPRRDWALLLMVVPDIACVALGIAAVLLAIAALSGVGSCGPGGRASEGPSGSKTRDTHRAPLDALQLGL